MKLKVKVTTYKNHLIIETLEPKQDANFFPCGGNRIGCVLINTQKYLGMSKEAADLAKTIQKSGDDIGDISVWTTDNGRHCFSWIGGLRRFVDMKVAEGDNKGITELHYVEIKNEPPTEAIKLIDERNKDGN